MSWPSLVGVPVIVLGALASAPSATPDPPSSLEPVAKPATVRLSFHSEAVVACKVRDDSQAVRCEPRVQSVGGDTALTFWPIPAPTLRAREDTRKPVSVTVAGEGRSDATVIKLAPGAWRLDWARTPEERHLDVSPGALLRIRLEQTSGQCVPDGKQCRLHAGDQRHVRVTEG